MLNLSNYITFNQEAILSPNLADRWDSGDRQTIASAVIDGYEADDQSRSDWLQRNEKGLDLALQITEQKSFPWPNCSNIAFPLVTIAALQFESRSYPEIFQGNKVVHCRVPVEDPTGELTARAMRVETHMNYQLLEEQEDWEAEHDRLLVILPIVGTVWKKTYYFAAENRVASELVLPTDLVVDYWAKSIDTARRISHIINMPRNDIWQRCLTGTFLDVTKEGWFLSPGGRGDDERRRNGTTAPQDGDSSQPITIIEQHCWLDLDGDGYEEPYIVTVALESRQLLRIVANCHSEDSILKTSDGRIYYIQHDIHFTTYTLIPSPDGGIYGLGFGLLLGPLNASVNSIINQLVDAGTMAVAAGGFLGRGAKIRGGTQSFSPLEWKTVDATGDDLRKNIIPLPVREPSAVLFNLLSMIVDFSSRIPGSTEALAGINPGQNTPAETNRSMIAQGLKIYAAAFKRIWRSMRQEFRKVFLLNSQNLPETADFGDGVMVRREDYRGKSSLVIPVADPEVQSDEIRFAQARMIAERAAVVPGYDPVAVEHRLLRAMRVDGIEQLYPGPDKIPPGKNLKLQIEEMKLQSRQLELQLKGQMFVAQLQEDSRLNSAQIAHLESLALAVTQDADVNKLNAIVNAINSSIAMAREQERGRRENLATLMQTLETMHGISTERGSIPGMAGASRNTPAS